MRLIILLAGLVGALAGVGLLAYAIVEGGAILALSVLPAASVCVFGGLVLVGLAAIMGQLEALGDRIAAAPRALPVSPLPTTPIEAAKPASSPIAKSAPLPPVKTAPLPPVGKASDKPAEQKTGNLLEAPVAASALAAAALAAEKIVPPLSAPHGAPVNGSSMPPAPLAASVASVAPASRELDLAGALASALDIPPKAESGMPAPPVRSAPPLIAVSPPGSPAQEAPPIIVRSPTETASQAPPLGGLDRQDALLPPSEDDAADEAPALDMPARPAVLKSGVIEGMSYTLYADGSVDAELAGGMKHFVSIADWRSHMRGEQT